MRYICGINIARKMTAFFRAIESLFVDFLFKPFDWFREMQLDSWFGANTINWILMIIGFVAMFYWLGQLKKFNANNEERKDITGHSFL